MTMMNQVDIINPLFLLTAKPVVYLVNLSEKDYIRQKNKHLPKIAQWVGEHSTGDPIIPLSISFEERLTRFESDAAAEEECKSLGTKSALPKVIVTMRQSLNLGSFFTTGADEVRQWTVRKGIKAPQAAGVIHTGKVFFFGGGGGEGIPPFFIDRRVIVMVVIQRKEITMMILIIGGGVGHDRFRKDFHPSHRPQIRRPQGGR